MMDVLISFVGRIVQGVIEYAFEAVFTATGRRLLGLFGWRPHDVIALLVGMVFWFLTGVFVVAAIQK